MKRYAILISCEEYKEFNNIFYCHSDALLMQNVLCEYCDYEINNTGLLILYIDADENNTDLIYSHITDITSKLEEDDTFLFYFAGHGTVIDNDAFLILPNTKISDIKNTSLSLKKIGEITKKSKATIFRIIDACHSGIDVRGNFSRGFITNLASTSWATLASCSEDEYSYPDTNYEQGIFTYYVANEIKKWKLNSDINFENLKLLVCEDMKKWCIENGKTQTPTLNGSLVGNISFATRNSKNWEEVIVQYNAEKTLELKENLMKDKELITVEQTNISLWEPNAGIKLPKSAEIETILGLNVLLKDREVKGILSNYESENYEFTVEPIWNRTMDTLRRRVLALGLEFVSEMVGVDNLSYIEVLPEFEVINLAMELGFINNTGKMRLMHSYETINHYLARDVDEEMTKSEADSIIRACFQYVLGIEESSLTIEYNDFRNRLKLEKFDSDSNIMQMLGNSPYFYKRTTIRTFINLIATTEGAEFENVISNFEVALNLVWEGLSSDDKYFIGITYSKYVNKGNEKYIAPFKSALIKVGGFDYVPENLRSLSFVAAAKKIKSVHYAMYNFYNEPSAVKALENMGSKIPKPAIKDAISAVFMVIMGNAYGRSHDALPHGINILKKLSDNDWVYYMENCLPYDEEVLIKLSSGDNRTLFWCQTIKELKIEKIEFSNNKVQNLITYSVKEDKNNVKAIAGAFLKKLQSK